MKKKLDRILRLFIVFVSITSLLSSTTKTDGAMDISTANPNASEDTRKVLTWIINLPNRSTNRILSGQYAGNMANYDHDIEELFTETNKYPALLGADYGWWKNWGQSYIPIRNQKLIDYWNNGGLITICWHASNPSGSSSSVVDLQNLITDGTPLNQSWMAMLDEVADWLATLQDSNVVVLWRPFHEMNLTRSSHWWCEGTVENFTAVWRHMFNYFTYTKKLNNLLWVYGAGASMGGNGGATKYYPGDSYVDIVGLSKYFGTSPISVIDNQGLPELLDLEKPFAFTEFGPGTGSVPPGANSYYCPDAINDIRNHQNARQATWFLFWNGNNRSMVDQLNPAGLLNDSWVITRDEVDWRSASDLPPEDEVKPGDLNGDSNVDIEDLIIVVVYWEVENSPGDADNDGMVNIEDLLVVVRNWGS